jgi:hypothetical protein
LPLRVAVRRVAGYPGASRLSAIRLIVSPVPGSCLEHTIAKLNMLYGPVRCRRILRESASQGGTDIDMELHLFTCVLFNLTYQATGATFQRLHWVPRSSSSPIPVSKAALQFRLFCALAVKLSTRGPGKHLPASHGLSRYGSFLRLLTT